MKHDVNGSLGGTTFYAGAQKFCTLALYRELQQFLLARHTIGIALPVSIIIGSKFYIYI